jgi:hypothetical protein
MRYFKYFPTTQFDMDGNNQYRTVVDQWRVAKIRDVVQKNASYYRWYDIQDGERPDHVSYKLYGSVDYHWTFFVVNENLKNLYKDWPQDQAYLEEKIKDKYDEDVLTFSQVSFSITFPGGVRIQTEVANALTPGETIQGLISGATATYVSKDTNLGWMVVTDITGEFIAGEAIYGLTSGDFFGITGQTKKYNAAHHYEKDGEVVFRLTPLASKVTFWEWEVDENENKKQIKVIRPEHVGRLASQFRKAINE